MSSLKQDLSIGPVIRELRKRVGLTQEQVVAQMQIKGCSWMSRSIYSQIEMGTHGIRVSELIALKQIFKVDYNALFAPAEQAAAVD